MSVEGGFKPLGRRKIGLALSSGMAKRLGPYWRAPRSQTAWDRRRYRGGLFSGCLDWRMLSCSEAR